MSSASMTAAVSTPAISSAFRRQPRVKKLIKIKVKPTPNHKASNPFSSKLKSIVHSPTNGTPLSIPSSILPSRTFLGAAPSPCKTI